MALAAGAYLYHDLPESPEMERATRWGMLLTSIAVSLVFLLRTLKGPMAPTVAFLGRNGWLLVGIVVSVLASIGWGASTFGGLLDMPPALRPAVLTWSSEWLIVLVFAVAALFLSPPE